MQLLEAEHFHWLVITEINGGKGLEHKLRQLGLIPGDRVRILRHAPLGGPLLVEIEGRSIAVGRGIAAKIQVEDRECVSP